MFFVQWEEVETRHPSFCLLVTEVTFIRMRRRRGETVQHRLSIQSCSFVLRRRALSCHVLQQISRDAEASALKAVVVKLTGQKLTRENRMRLLASEIFRL